MKKLEEIFNINPVNVSDIEDEEENSRVLETIQENENLIRDVDNAIDKIDYALPMVTNLEASDKEMDEIAELAMEKFKDLMDLGMNCEARVAGPIFQSASTLLNNALTAKQSKIDKKLRMIDLQLKKARLDQYKKPENPEDKAIESQGMVLDRNSLMKLINESKPDKTDK